MKYIQKPTLSSYRQRGVALIQVLLTVSMILILVVQLSKGSKEQVNTAIRLKNKNEALITMNSVLERTKFDLLTQQRHTKLNSVISSRWNFYGQPFSYVGVDISLQDAAGLISLPYFSDYLESLSEEGNIKQTIENLKLWQGVANSSNIPRDFRGGNMQYSSEVMQVPGWIEANIKLDLTTYLPTTHFNPNTAPNDILRAFAKEGEEDLLLQRRASGELTLIGFNSMSKIKALDGISLYPSDTIHTEIIKNMGDWYLSRRYLFKLSLDSRVPIKHFGY